MKKVVKFFAAAAIVLPLVFSSCASEDPAKPLEVDMTKTGTFKVTILAITDQSTSDQEYAAAPITLDNIAAAVPYRDLNIYAYGGYYDFYIIPKENMKYDTSTGVLEITVPTADDGVYLYVGIFPASGTCKMNEAGKSKTVEGYWYYSGYIQQHIRTGETYSHDSVEMGFDYDYYKAGDEVPYWWYKY